MGTPDLGNSAPAPASTDSGVSLISPDGGTRTPVPVEPGSDGTYAVPPTTEGADEAASARDAEYDKLSAIWDKNHPDGEPATTRAPQPRDPVTKRFIKADGTQTDNEAEAAIGPDGKPKVSDQSQTEGKEQPAADVPMPKSWSAQRKALWDSFSPESRQFLAAREKQIGDAFAVQGQTLATYRPLGELLLANRDMFEFYKVNPIDGVARLLAVQRGLDKDAVGVLAGLSARYKVNPADIAKRIGVAMGSEPTGGEQQGEVPPAITALQAKLDAANARIAKFEQWASGRDQREHQTAIAREHYLQNQVNDQIEEFGKTKEHFEAVRGQMAVFFASGMAETPEDAYDMACRADKNISKKLRESEAKAQQDVANAEREKHVTAAKRATTINVGGNGRQIPPPSKGKSWDDPEYLSSVFDRAQQPRR